MISPSNAVIFTALFIFIYIIIRKIRSDGGQLKGTYDERQLLARGRAFQSGLLVCLLEFAFLLLRENMHWSLPMTDEALYSLMFLFPIGFVSVLCIQKDAYIGVRSNLSGYIRLCVLVILIDAIVTFLHVKDLIVDGKLTGDILTPGTGLLFLIMLSALLLRKAALRKEEERDEES